MEESARRYARRILLLHLALLCIVVLVVYFAGREIYQSTRQQVMDQTVRRQLLLSNQTARGIESYYGSILSDLDLLQRAENDDSPPPPPLPTSRPLAKLRTFAFAKPLWKQLEGRALQLFLFDKAGQRATSLGSREGFIPLPELLDHNKPWLTSVTGKAISKFQIFGDRGVHIVCIPADPQATRVLAAVVPITEIEDLFLKKLNADPDITATLVDESFTAMAISDRKLIGLNFLDVPDSDKKAGVVALIAKGQPFSLQVENTVKIGNIEFPPAIIAFEPINLPNRRWWVHVALPIAEINGVLDQIFHRAIMWAAFLVVSVTAILVSTSVQMIRGRVRTERIRHDMLKKELEQARQIQLAWLPPTVNDSKTIDIAGINQPASHISGDFYNWFELPDGRTAVTIGDVTGHGMSGAFLMATTQLLVRTTMLRLGDPGQCMTDINRQLCQQVFNGQFVTMLILVIDPKAQSLEIAVGGHPPPLIWNGERFLNLPTTPQLVLGVDRDEVYPTERFALAAGSPVVLFTDGVTDAQSADGSRLRTEGFLKLLTAPHESAADLLSAMIARVDHFRGKHELGDDLTLVTLQYRHQPVSPEGVIE